MVKGPPPLTERRTVDMGGGTDLEPAEVLAVESATYRHLGAMPNFVRMHVRGHPAPRRVRIERSL